ncbi:MAG: helix-turn-helix domain-containing protein [Bryobacteraceae bacterium]
MSSVGETLRRERLRKDLSLEQISRETKISARLLDAIEKDQFDALPGGVFAKSFVRQYARFLGLDEAELAGEVEKVVHPASELSSLASAAPEPAFKVPRMVDWEGPGRSNSSVLPALALVVAVMLVCSAMYAWWQRSRHPAVATAPAAAAQKTSAAPSKPAPPAPVTPAVASNPETASKTEVSTPQPPSGAPAAQAEPTNPAAPIQISLASTEDVWVHVWADGQSAMVGTLQPNGAKAFSAENGVKILIGNAGGLQLTVNGKPAGELGPRGQVRTVEITSAGVHILAPPPKPAPAPEPL